MSHVSHFPACVYVTLTTDKHEIETLRVYFRPEDCRRGSPVGVYEFKAVLEERLRRSRGGS